MGRSPEIWVVVPFSRPEMRRQVLDNFYRQTYDNKRLCIIENGNGISTFTDDRDYDQILLSPRHQSHARNTAIKWLKKNHPLAYWVSMDDDDYYGPGYLTEHAEKAEYGRVSGKKASWVKFDSGLVYFGHHWSEDTEAPSLMGGTIGCYVSESPLFPIKVAGEEFEFCEDARRSGMSILTTSQNHYCYDREGDPHGHAYKADENKMWRVSGWTGVRVNGSCEQWISGPPPNGPGDYHKEAA